MEKGIRANEDNDLKFYDHKNSQTQSVEYERDGNGQLVLDEKGNPIPKSGGKLEYFTE